MSDKIKDCVIDSCPRCGRDYITSNEWYFCPACRKAIKTRLFDRSVEGGLRRIERLIKLVEGKKEKEE